MVFSVATLTAIRKAGLRYLDSFLNVHSYDRVTVFSEVFLPYIDPRFWIILVNNF